jgi:hypothetical protein
MNSRYGVSWATPDRPFVPLIHILGYSLSPGSFSGLNVVMVLLLVSRSWLTYNILRQFNVQRLFAFAVAVILAVFPADTGFYYMGALAVYFSWVAYLFAFYLLIRYWQRPRLITLIGMWVALIINLGIYEAAYSLILVSPLALLIIKRKNRRIWIATTIRWYIFPALNALRFILTLLLQPDTFRYQSEIVSQNNALGSLVENLGFIFQRHFFTAWFELNVIRSDWLLALGIGVIVLGLCVWLIRQKALSDPDHVWEKGYLWAVVIGIAIIVLSMFVLLFTSAANSTFRTYFVSSIGAALVIVSLLRLVIRNNILFSIAVMVMVVLGFGQLLERHRVAIAETETQQGLVARVMEVIPAVEPHSTLVIMDESTEREIERLVPNRWLFQSIFLVLYDEPTLTAALCYDDDDLSNPSHYCNFQEGSIEARISPSIVWTRPYDQVQLIRYTTEREFVLEPSFTAYQD